MCNGNCENSSKVIMKNQQLMYDKLKYIEDYLIKLAPVINNITVDVEKILLAVTKVDYVEIPKKKKEVKANAQNKDV